MQEAGIRKKKAYLKETMAGRIYFEVREEVHIYETKANPKKENSENNNNNKKKNTS